MTDTRNFANALENEGSAPVYLLDKKLDERTSQSAVETTDYVLLEDTDGAFHKIAKNSFNEAVRGALGSLLNNLDKGTNIKSVVGLGSASPVNDLGTVTLANLASLLGVPTYTTTSSVPANWHTTISGAEGMGIVVFYKGLYTVTSALIRGFKIGQTILVSFYSSGEQKVVFLRYTYYNGEWHDYVVL